MAPGRRKGSGRAAAAAAAQQQLKIGDLVLAKMKGFPAWPAEITEPEKWGFSAVRKKLLVFFYGTKQIAFCNYADIEPFTEEKKKSLLLKRQGKGADFVRAVDEIIVAYENMKKQSIEVVNSGEQVTEKLEKLESVRCDSSGNSPETSSVDHNYKLKEENDSKENHVISNLEDGSGTSIEIDPQKKELVCDEPVEKVSILDHLRHDTITMSTSSRKRKSRENPHQSSQKNVASLRKSTSLSSADALDQMDSALSESQDKPVEKKETNGVASVLPLNNIIEDNGDETAGSNIAPEKMNVEEKLSPSRKQEVLTNGYVDDSAEFSGKLELPKEALVFKKKRKPIRKRMNNTVEFAAVNKETESQVGQANTVLESLNPENMACEISVKSDGDEHLPLVKRARIRMGKTSGDEAEPSSPVDDIDKKSEIAINVNNIDMPCRTPSGGNDCPPNGISEPVKEELSTTTENNPSLPSPTDISFWKAKKYQMKDFDLDVEAALPPSKRLHRAFEAMSANAAETKEYCAETVETLEVNGFKCSPKQSSSEISLEEKAGLVAESVPSSLSNGVITDVPRVMPQLNKPALPSSEAKSDYKSSNFLVNQKSDGILESAAANPNEMSVSDASVDDFQKAGLKSCSSKLSEEIVATPSNCLTENLCSSDSVNKLVCPSLLVEENNDTEIAKPILEKSDTDLKPALNKSDSVLKPALKVDVNSDIAPPDEAVTRVSAADAYIMNSTLEFYKTARLDEDSQTHDMQDIAKETIQQLTPSDKCCSPELTPMKELIAAAQAKRFLSRSTSFSDNHVRKTALSPSTVHKEGPSRHFSPPVIISHKYATDDRALPLQSNVRSPQVGHLPKDLSRSFSRAEVNAARKAFEAFLCTLSRTKDSIGRATRLAIDCAKFGIAGEVIDIIVHNLERETNLYKRVDLFFLVDSITQCSRNQKGGAGDVYCSLVQAVLPRLLSSAAPRGSAAFENRRQCLKVLRLWLERKTLPESIIRHHIRELDMLNETTFPGGSSRRPLRTERAFNDPVREMEGMLVDEYGSNTSMPLADFMGTNLLEVEGGSTSEEKSFEAVTPERPNDTDNVGEVQMPTSKHRHVLEDIDGELEMEDVAPREVVVGSSCCFPADDFFINSRNQKDEQQLSSFAPPLPEDRPPSPPPLPSSPPPFAPPSSTSHSAMPHQQPIADAVPESSSNLHLSVSNNKIQVCQPEPVCQQPSVPNACLVPSEPYYAPGYAGPKPMPPPVSVCAPGAYGNFPGSHLDLHSRDNCPPAASSSLNSKPYYLPPPPPPPTVSNQFSYIHAEAQRGQAWHSSSTFQDRSSYMPDNQRGNFYNDRGAGGPFHHEVSDGSRFPSAVHPGPLHSEKLEGSSTSRQYGPPSEPQPNPCNGWSVPPRLSNYSSFTSRPPVESPTPRAAGAPGYWRPR